VKIAYCRKCSPVKIIATGRATCEVGGHMVNPDDPDIPIHDQLSVIEVEEAKRPIDFQTIEEWIKYVAETYSDILV